MSDLIRREDLENWLRTECYGTDTDDDKEYVIGRLRKELPTTASPWHRVEDELPEEAGEYIVAYHPCLWNDVKTRVTEIGIDTFRGKTSWAKRKFQRVTHWMEKPEPPKEGA